jgi:LCP family protein required for cell wall assembly
MGRVVIALAAVLAMALTGMGWWATRNLVGGMTVSQALGLDAPRSTDGSMNILLIGLDSRKDQDGNDLPDDILDQLHAGGSDDGGYNTNTLILAHVGTDNHVVAFSIPRDDYVPVDGITGYDHIKIKQAYGLAKAQKEQKLTDSGESDQQTLEREGRETGRAATLRAVRNLTGVPIDYFAEVNLAGFYDVTNALGGVQVCLNAPVQDDYSGADFPAGPQRLDAAQALAFVRQRHGLDNGDLDRTHRQQAFLASVLHQLAQVGTFADVNKMSALIDVARKDIVLSSGWGKDQFRRVGEIAGDGNLTFTTLPVLGYDNVDGQAVNIIDAAAIKAQVAAAFNQDIAPAPTATSKPSSSIEVINAGSTEGLAAEISRALASRGFTAGQVRNVADGEPTATAVAYGPGAGADASTAAKLLGIAAAPTVDPTLAANTVRVTLGAEYVAGAAPSPTSGPASGLGSGSTDASEGSDVPPDAGKPINGGSVPCVN